MQSLSLACSKPRVSLEPTLQREKKRKKVESTQLNLLFGVLQRVLQQALQGALGTLNSSLNNELHLRTISANIGLFGVMKEITD